MPFIKIRTPEQAAIREATPEELAPMAVADGAMGLKNHGCQ